MIIFVAPYPSEQNQKEGMIQRIASIDALVSAEERSYLDISFRRNWKKSKTVAGLVSVYQLNALVHLFYIYKLVQRSHAIYIHSVFNALKIFPFLFRKGNILDAHGIVPEELKEEGRAVASLIYSLAERLAIKGSSVLVCVTDSMRQHFKQKYGRDSQADLTLPILPSFEEARDADAATEAIQRSETSVIYAGGLQAWQNIDRMISAAAQMPSFDYTFLTMDVEKLDLRLKSGGVREYVCKSVRPDDIYSHYLKSNFGFILRDPIQVNAVACPTKLMEYIYWGVIPIAITSSIGDFNESNLSAITLHDFLLGKVPNPIDASNMRKRNRATINTMIRISAANKNALQKLLRADRGATLCQ